MSLCNPRKAIQRDFFLPPPSHLDSRTRSIGSRRSTRRARNQALLLRQLGPPLRIRRNLIFRLLIAARNEAFQEGAFLGLAVLFGVVEVFEVPDALFGRHGFEFLVEGLAVVVEGWDMLVIVVMV